MNHIVGSFAILDSRDRLKVSLLLLLSVINSLVQTLGIVSIMPFIAILSEPSLIDTNRQILLLKQFLGITDYKSLLFFFGIFTFCSLILSHFFSTLTSWVNQLFFYHKEHSLTHKLLEIYLSKKSTAFYKVRKTQILKYILSDVDRVLIGTQLAVISLISNALICIVVFSFLLYLDVWVTVATTIMLTTSYLLIYGVLATRINEYGAEFASLESKIYAALNHAIDMFREIRISGHQKRFVEQYTEPSKEVVNHSIKYYLITFLPTQLLEVLAFGLLIIIATYFATMETAGSVNVISLISIFAFATYRLVPLLNSVFDSIEGIIYNSTVLEELLEQFDESDTDPVLLVESKDTDKRLELRKSFGLKQATFRYNDKQSLVLDNYSVSIKKNSFVCLSGKSGAGKSTILDILLGLITPEHGGLYVDGQRLEKESIRYWQNNIGYVPQKILFLNGSVAENIAFGIRPENIDHDRVRHAAKLAAIDELIEQQLADGYDTILGDGGVMLSGGEKQRIGIARSLYHDPQILIFDEATNALDKETETQIINSIKLLNDRTIVFVSHKQAVADAADENIIINKLAATSMRSDD